MIIYKESFYTYFYLRKNKTPYYVGKGIGDRAYQKHNVPVPKDKSRIPFIHENISEELALSLEELYIALLGRKDKGTGILRNRTDGGEGCSGFIHSDEARRKISESKKGKKRGPQSEEHRRRISESMKGKSPSEEHRKKLSEAKKGITKSEETRRKLSEAKKGNQNGKGKRSEETRMKMSEAKKGKAPPNKGKSPSEETRMKLSEAKKGITKSEEHKRKMSESQKLRRIRESESLMN